MTYAPIPNEDVDVGSPLSTALVTQLRDTAEYARIGYVSVSGATQALDLEAGQLFDAGTLTADTTVSFSNVPTEARWTYTADVGAATSFDIEAAVYDDLLFSVSTQDTSPTSFTFKPDGTKMYLCGNASDSIYEYTLSTAWDVSTLSYNSVSLSVTSQEGEPAGIHFKPDGTKMYISGPINDRVNQYTLSTAWDLSTASYDGVNLNVSGQDTTMLDCFFKDDGTKMYLLGLDNDRVYQYSLSTAWNLSTASYDSVSFSVTSQASTPLGLFFKEDGTKMYMVGNSSIYQYTLSTAWDLSTASYDSISFTPSQGPPRSVYFKADGSKMITLSISARAVYQYTTSTPCAVTLPASVQNPPAEAVGPNDQVSYTFFTADGGTNVYLINEEVL